uniref:Carboxylesterase type B domain-containing protein n=1 Tax=Romanomermis culicivorax TaxID=13658 RepID=A0A915J8N1_ROMCU
MIMTLLCGRFYILIAIIIPGIGAYIHIDNVTRKCAYGSINGRLVKTVKMGHEAEIYLGVPYAQPPIGELRFKYPLPPKPWADVYDATYERPWCIQFWYTDERIDKRPQSEDCLYLTIYVPRPVVKGIEKARYPVLFWVHGGSYQVGGSNAFPVQGTVDNVVSRGVVFVVINYRLGALGFMSSLNNNLPGNYGLEDQMAALKFVKENIEYFNGDPDSVTIGGESAGASSVGLLSASPKTKGYFHKVIIRSGSSLAPWSVRTINTDLNTDKVIAGLNCQKIKKLSLTTKNNEQYSSSDEEEAIQNENVMNCLRLLDSTDFVQQWRAIAHEDLMMIVTKTASRPVNYNHPFLAHTYFTPVIDGYRLNESILPHYARDMARNNSKLPLMISSMTGECTGYITWLTYLEKVMNINMQDLEYVVPSTQYANAEQVKQAVYKRYIGDALWKSTFNYKKALVDIASDQNFVAPIAEEARFYVENGAPVYVYIFDHGNEDLYFKHVAHGVYDVGSSHGFDMVYLFQSTAVVDPGVDKPIKWSDMDLKVTEFLAQTLYNFVATG